MHPEICAELHFLICTWSCALSVHGSYMGHTFTEACYRLLGISQEVQRMLSGGSQADQVAFRWLPQLPSLTNTVLPMVAEQQPECMPVMSSVISANPQQKLLAATQLVAILYLKRT